MNKNKIPNFSEILCFTLILSYFFINNIYIVFIGILFSIYLINIDNNESFNKFRNINLFIKKEQNYSKKADEAICSIPSNIHSNKKNSKLSLVEIIEEVGFIPSMENNENRDPA
tara:strand:+ start:598 stop:939 length:342 start_codon:yes stop_codon:yes gene_type:complete